MDKTRSRLIEERGISLPRLGLYYGGAWHDSADGRTFPVDDPSTGFRIADVAAAASEDVERAALAGEEGFRVWRDTSPARRGAALRAWAKRIADNAEELALLDAVDAGMPLSQVRKDIGLATEAIEFFAGLVTELKGTTIPSGASELTYTVRRPLGVVARIVAFNHPLMFAASRAAAPLAAGNALILKPSELAPLSALRLAELSDGLFPDGVFNVLPGGLDCGEALSRSPRIRKIGLIGGARTGRAVMRSASETLKETALELGGKNALIAYPDSDVEAVADAIFRGMNFAWGGQSCGSTSRAFLHADIHDRVVESVREKCTGLVMGPPSDAATGMGCLISTGHRDRVHDFVATALREGAKLVCGGAVPDKPGLVSGAFYPATVLSGVTSSMQVAQEEVFGPVLAILEWDDEISMIEDVNSTPYGLTASIWTNDLARAFAAVDSLEVGYIWVNGVGRHIHGAPFGGVKQSGIGREESIEELFAYTAITCVNVTYGGRIVS